ncbi:MAG TPA: glycosyltransferase [Terracidiphilus sp.]
MRIAYLLTSLGIGGAEKQVVALAEHMATHGHPVLLIVLRERQHEEWPTHLSVVYLDLHKGPLPLSLGILRARRVLHAFHPDLLHSHTFPANLFARILRLLGVVPAVISTLHNVYEGGSLRTLAYRLTDPLVVRTTAVSKAVARQAAHSGAVPARKCTVLANAIDTAEFAPDPMRREEVRTRLNAADHFIWFAAGRIVNAKGFVTLLEAFARVWPAFPHAQLWIAGAGRETAPPHLRYRAFAVPRGTMDRVRRLGLRRDMPALLDAADAFVLSSSWEGMPLVVGEAMAMAKPIVATDVGGVREMLGDTGALVPARDTERLAAAMFRTMQQAKKSREAVGRAARARIEAEFSTTIRFPAWEAFYASLAE